MNGMQASEPFTQPVNRTRWRAVMRWVMAIFYFAAGVMHLYFAAAVLQIVPDWVPYPKHVVFITGILEMVGAIALLTHRLRAAAGIAFALYALCVWPANIKHAIEGIPMGEMQLGWWYHAPRLAFQPVLIWWALFVGEVIDWPFKRKSLPTSAS